MSTNSGPAEAPKAKVPKIVMDEMVFQKIMHWVNKSQYEVSGLGKVVVEQDGTIRITEVFLLPQKNTHTTTDIEPQDVAKLAFLTKDSPGELRFWWHSHVNMGVFWSGTDVATIKELAMGGWFVNTVFNKKYQMKTCLAVSVEGPEDLPMDRRIPIMYDDQPLTIERAIPQELLVGWDKEYDEKVTNVIPKFTASRVQQGRFPHYPGTPQVFTAEERAVLAEMARELNSDETTPMSSFPGMEDEDETDGSQSSSKLHSRGMHDVRTILDRRDKVELSISRMEDRIEELENAGAQIPKKLNQAMERAALELMEIDDELDQLEELGIITPADRAMLLDNEVPRHRVGE